MAPDALEVLYEAGGLPAYQLPEQLQAAYGGLLGFAEPRLVANFVATLDGIVAIPDLPRSTRIISGGSSADRFLLGLLRACADVVLLGAGTLHAHPETVWTGQRAYPAAADAFAELRRRRGQPPQPELAVLTTSGQIDTDHPALRGPALVLTSQRGASALTGRLPDSCAVLPVGEGKVDLNVALAALHDRGQRLSSPRPGRTCSAHCSPPIWSTNCS
jgi:riboflavin biosynthesis pyrimidine reductase